MTCKLLIVGTNFNLAKVSTVLCMSAATLSLSIVEEVDRLESLAYIKSITNAHSQNFINDIEHTGNNKHCQIANYHLFLSLEQVIVSIS